MWRYELHTPDLINAATLPCESWKPKMHVDTTSAFNINYRITVACITLHWQFHKICGGESYEWTFMSEHVFKVSTTSMHIWYQMVTPGSIMFRSKSKQVCIKRSCRSSMSWIIASCVLCYITPHISKFQAHDDPGPLWWECDTSDAIFFGNLPL